MYILESISEYHDNKFKNCKTYQDAHRILQKEIIKNSFESEAEKIKKFNKFCKNRRFNLCLENLVRIWKYYKGDKLLNEQNIYLTEEIKELEEYDKIKVYDKYNYYEFEKTELVSIIDNSLYSRDSLYNR